MASGYDIASGGDLDTVFAPQHSGWSQAAATEFFDGSGNDLNLRYAVLSTGTAAAATGFVDSAGNDLNTVFAGYGTTGVKVLTQPASVSGSSTAGTPSGTVTSNTTSCAGTKGGGTYTYTWHIASGSGVSFTNPNSATTAVTGTVPAAQSISGTMYCTISDGVTSVNTNTVTWSLHNTSTAYIFNGTVTAGEIILGSGSTEIRQIGFALAAITGSTVMGSISPANDINGHAIVAVYSSESGYPVPSSYGFVLVIAGTLAANYFSVMVANGASFNSSSASVSYQGGYTYWNWTDSSMVFPTSGSNYAVTLQ